MSPLTESWYWWSFNSWYPSFDSLLRLEWIPKRVWWPSPHALSPFPNDIFPFRSTLIWCFLVAEMNSKFSILDIVKTKNEPRNQSLTSVVLISSHPFFSSFRECLATLKVGTRTSSHPYMQKAGDFHHFLLIFTIYALLSRFTFCRDLRTFSAIFFWPK